MESTEADEQEPLNITPKNLDLKSEESTENFQKFIFELFEKNGILNDLRAYLRGHIVNVIKSTNSGEPTSCQKHFTQRLELSNQALNILIAEYFLRMEFSYTLSVFISEIPLANMLFEFARTLMKCSEISDVSQVFFRENDVWSILNCLGIKCDSEHACKIVEMYTSEEKIPLLLCIMQCRPMYRKDSICMDNAVTSEEYATSDRSTDTDGINKKSDKRKCCHYTVCRSCSSRESRLKEKISKRKVQYNQSIHKASLNSLDMNAFMKNMSVVEKGIINEMFEDMKAVYETEVAMVKQDEEDKIRKSIASHAMQLQKHREQLEEAFKAREMELTRSVDEKKKFLWRLAGSLRQQHRHMNSAMDRVRDHADRLAAKESSLKTQIQEAEDVLRKRGEDMRQQIASELRMLDQHLLAMKRERDAIDGERQELESLKNKEINNNKCDDADIRRHYDILKDELQDLKRYLEMANAGPNALPKCSVEKGTVTDAVVNNLMNNEHFVLKADRVMSDKVNNDLSRRKNVNFDMSSDGFNFNGILVRPSRSSVSSDVDQSDRDHIDCDVRDINRDRNNPDSYDCDRNREIRARSHDCDNLRARSRDRNSNHSGASNREFRSLDRASRSRNRDFTRDRDRNNRSRDRFDCGRENDREVRDRDRDRDDGVRDHNRSCDRVRGRSPYAEVERLREENERLSILARQQSEHIASLAGARAQLRPDLAARPQTAPNLMQPFAVASINSPGNALSAVGGGEQLTIFAERPRVRIPTDTLPFIGVLKDNRRNCPGRKARRARGSANSSAEAHVIIVSEQLDDEQTTTQTVPRENTVEPVVIGINKTREKSPKSVLRDAKEKLRNKSNIREAPPVSREKSPNSTLREAKLRLRKLELEAEAVENSYRAFRRQREEGDRLDIKKSKSSQRLEQSPEADGPANYQHKRDLINRDFDKYLKEYQTKFSMPPFKNKNAVSEMIKPIPVAFSETEPNINRMNVNFLETPLSEFRKLYRSEKPREKNVVDRTPSPLVILDKDLSNDKDDSRSIKSKDSGPRHTNGNKRKEFQILQDNINRIYSCSPNMATPNVRTVFSPESKLNDTTLDNNIDIGRNDDKNLLRVDIENVCATNSVPVDTRDHRLLVVVKSSIDAKDAASDPDVDEKNAITTQMTVLVSPKDRAGERSLKSDYEKIASDDIVDDIFQINPKKDESSEEMLELSKEDSGGTERDEYPDDFSADVDNYNSRSDCGQRSRGSPGSRGSRGSRGSPGSPGSLAKDSEENFWES